MRTTAQALGAAPTADRSWAGILSDLVKARLTILVLLTTLVGFYLGSQGSLNWILMCHSLIGTGLLACGASALNQWLEREPDAQMRRTASRPLPAGRLQPDTVLAAGSGACLAGLLQLLLAVNPLTFLLGALTAGLYLFVYTPLKRVTWLNTMVGAVPGALPPLMGWTAARGEASADGLCLFAIQFLWQIPHFLAIAWIYRSEYAQAGFRMLPVVDVCGRRTGRYAAIFAGCLWAVSLWPVLQGLVGMVYLVGALGLGGLFVAVAVRFAWHTSLANARALFLASVLYLPLVLLLLVIDKIRLG